MVVTELRGEGGHATPPPRPSKSKSWRDDCRLQSYRFHVFLPSPSLTQLLDSLLPELKLPDGWSLGFVVKVAVFVFISLWARPCFTLHISDEHFLTQTELLICTNVFLFTFFLKKNKILKDISPLCGVTDVPVLNFWWRLSSVSNPDTEQSVVCVLHRLLHILHFETSLMYSVQC